MSNLRSRLIKLAHQNPELRGDILPLLERRASSKEINRNFKDVDKSLRALKDSFFSLAINAEGDAEIWKRSKGAITKFGKAIDFLLIMEAGLENDLLGSSGDWSDFKG